MASRRTLKNAEKKQNIIEKFIRIGSYYLDISATRATDVGIAAIATNCSKLNFFNISSCLAITNKAIDVIAENSRNLAILYVNGCPLVEEAAVFNCLLKLSKLETVFFKLRPYTRADFTRGGILPLPTERLEAKATSSSER